MGICPGLLPHLGLALNFSGMYDPFAFQDHNCPSVSTAFACSVPTAISVNVVKHFHQGFVNHPQNTIPPFAFNAIVKLGSDATLINVLSVGMSLVIIELSLFFLHSSEP